MENKDNSLTSAPESSPKIGHHEASISHQQGYDYDFTPPLDPKYECPICLLCQRDPIQTNCGHRFCKDCILMWIRTERQRCPEDNSPITEQDVFPDNFAKREILSLLAHCPNTKNGCDAVVQIGQMEQHQGVCSFQMVLCPNGCPMVLRQQDVTDHVAKECLHRVIECSLCYAKFPLDQQQAHFETCPMVSLSCPFCQANLPRQEHSQHLQEDCQQVPVCCPFVDVGCDLQVPRDRLQDHMMTQVQRHLRLLAGAHARLQNFVVRLATYLENVRSEAPSSQPPQDCNSASTSAVTPALQFDSLSLEPPSEHQPNSRIPEPSLLSSAEGLMKELFQRNIHLEQRHREQEIKMSTMRQQLADCETQVALARELSVACEGRFCGGVYVWRPANISRLVQEARTVGHSRLVHSPGFYTDAFGYKACLRLNVVAKDVGACYLSLFVHFMQGEYDDSLPWPFHGTITLAIVDQSGSAAGNHQDIHEMMVTKPGLAAFQRPNSDRNPKGFGYTDFVAVDTLTKGGYLNNDILVIRATVSSANRNGKE